MARRVEERDLPSVVLDLVGADVLRDAACLGLDDGRLTDRIEQRRLTVVDVPHDRYHRRARDELVLGVLEDLRLGLFLIGEVLDRHLALQLGRDELDFLVRQRLRRRPHLAEVHQDLDDLPHLHAERLGEVADSDARLDGRRPGGRDDLARLSRPGRLRAVALLASVARPRSGLIDDDAPLAPLARASLAGPHRAVWPVGS